MKVLDKKYKGTTWSNGKYPKPIMFDTLTTDQIPFLEMMGFGFLVIEVCDKCEKQRCKCKKIAESTNETD